MSLPEAFRSIFGKTFIKLVLYGCNFKGRMSRVEDKKYHTECEKISFLALVRLAHDNLRGHKV